MTSYDNHTLREDPSQRPRNKANCLVETLGRRHGSLDGQASHVLPALLQKRNQVVDGQHDVSDELILGHVNVADSDTHAQDLLQLELDRGLDLGDLGAEVLGVGDGRRELAGCERKLAR